MTKVTEDMTTRERLEILLKALRDGSYPQWAGALKETNRAGAVRGFCCEGVGCDLTVGILGEWVVNESGDNTFGGNMSYAPQNVGDFFGIDLGANYTGDLDKWLVREPVYNFEGDRVVYYRDVFLAHLNDNGTSFADIADKLESYYLNGGEELYEAWKADQKS